MGYPREPTARTPLDAPIGFGYSVTRRRHIDLTTFIKFDAPMRRNPQKGYKTLTPMVCQFANYSDHAIGYEIFRLDAFHEQTINRLPHFECAAQRPCTRRSLLSFDFLQEVREP